MLPLLPHLVFFNRFLVLFSLIAFILQAKSRFDKIKIYKFGF